MKPTIFIDGQEGTTGLQIYKRLETRTDIQLLRIDPGKRKDPEERQKWMNAADLVILCLPDEAAKEAMALVGHCVRPEVKLIDASTAHRTCDGWDYGFPELSPEHRERIAASRRVANPGCHATGFISAVYPLVQAGLVAKNAFLTCFSLTGYSGGGKKMIAQYEQDKSADLFAPRIYGLNQNHKHLPEIMKLCGLETAPAFCPVVDDYYKGMATTVPLPLPAGEVHAALCAHYAQSELIRVAPLNEGGMISANTMAGRDSLALLVNGNRERCTVTALFDNLGKGASGAAVQNLNLMLGFPETTGLIP